MREIQDMTLNLSRGIERLERRISERAEHFQREIDRFGSPEDALGIRMTAVPIGDEVRFSHVFHQGGFIQDFDISWRRVSLQTNDKSVPFDKFPFGFPGTDPQALLWRPILRGARAENNFLLEDYPKTDLQYVAYQELHCDGLVELGSALTGPNTDDGTIVLPDWPITMFAALAIWADQIRKQALAPTAEYALDVEISTFGEIKVYTTGNAASVILGYPRFKDPRINFPRYSLGDREEIPELLGLFHRDFWNSLGQNPGVEEGAFLIQGWPS